MADLSISGKMKVITLKVNFKEAFGSSLRVYIGKKFADDDATLASIRKSDAKGGEVKANGKKEKKIASSLRIPIPSASIKPISTIRVKH